MYAIGQKYFIFFQIEVQVFTVLISSGMQLVKSVENMAHLKFLSLLSKVESSSRPRLFRVFSSSVITFLHRKEKLFKIYPITKGPCHKIYYL